MAILLEGVRNIALPCTLVLIVPGLVLAATGGLRTASTAAIIIGAGLTAWLQAVVGVAPPRGVAGGLVLAVVMAAAILGLRAGPRPRASPAWMGHRLVPVAGGLAGGALSGLLWEPCVGPHLGEVLTRAPGDAAGTLLPLLAYIVGALLPIIAAAAVAATWDGPWRTTVARIGQALAWTIVGVLALGLDDRVVSALVRLSL